MCRTLSTQFSELGDVAMLKFQQGLYLQDFDGLQRQKIEEVQLYRRESPVHCE